MVSMNQGVCTEVQNCQLVNTFKTKETVVGVLISVGTCMLKSLIILVKHDIHIQFVAETCNCLLESIGNFLLSW